MKKNKKILRAIKYFFLNKLDPLKMEFSHHNLKEEIKLYSQVSKVKLKIT